MNILQFIKYLNRSKGWHIEGSYYALIDEWRSWWRGEYPAFHEIKEQGLDGNLHTRSMARLRMPKHACEDWASLLLGDKTTITVGDNATARWLLGEETEDQTGGVLGAMHFWKNANALVELAFRSGTGAFVLSVEGLQVDRGQAVVSPGAALCMDYLPAECILPITIRHGTVVDVAFASEVTLEGKSCIYLQTHRLGKNGYTITNEFFTGDAEDTDQATYKPEGLPAGMAAKFCTGSALPWFALMRPNLVKNRTGGPGLGMAVFADAIDAAKLADLAFDNYARDIHLGGKKVFYGRQMLQSRIDRNGEQHFYAPDQVRQQLFVHVPGADPDAEPEWHEYNPDLRVDDNSRAVQDALDYFSFKVGLGTRHYQFSSGGVKTATEYTGDRQDMVQHANRHQINIESALIQIMRALLWAGKTLLGAPIDPGTALAVHFDDSYIIDTGTRREVDRQDVRDGLMPRWRYIMEWRGLSEDAAKAMVAEIDGEGSADALTFG